MVVDQDTKLGPLNTWTAEWGVWEYMAVLLAFGSGVLLSLAADRGLTDLAILSFVCLITATVMTVWRYLKSIYRNATPEHPVTAVAYLITLWVIVYPWILAGMGSWMVSFLI
ncbi:MAG TPA: hypothetical protein HA263_08805 [Methanoregulaceae archaeon]|nr:hypothetical protein [Methanoregulaceae archaeon]